MGEPRDYGWNSAVCFFICAVCGPDEHLSAESMQDRFGLGHLGSRVSDFEDLATRMQAKGVEFGVDGHGPWPGTRIAFIRGPEHVQLELSESKG